MRRNRTGIFALILALLTTAVAADTDRAKAEQALQQLLRDIAETQAEIRRSKYEHREEQGRLREMDLALQESSLRIRELEGQIQANRDELGKLERQRQEYVDGLDERLARLAEQIRSLYRSSGQSRTRLVLNQDDPTRIARMLAYYEYVNRAQIEQISGLREALSQLDRMQAAIDDELERARVLQAEEREAQGRLEKQRTERSDLLETIAGRIENSESELLEMQANRRELEDLIERLSDVLSDIPENLEGQVGVVQRKGRLPMPVQGPVRHAFGQRRGAGLDWQGWLIGADPGTEVSAIAHGRVAYADWLRGYGLLMIIDHGDGFITLYGHNESLLRDAGEWVDAGEAVSIVGSNPGNTQGAYFEIRRNGKALDPAAWLAR